MKTEQTLSRYLNREIKSCEYWEKVILTKPKTGRNIFVSINKYTNWLTEITTKLTEIGELRNIILHLRNVTADDHRIDGIGFSNYDHEKGENFANRIEIVGFETENDIIYAKYLAQKYKKQLERFGFYVNFALNTKLNPEEITEINFYKNRQELQIKWKTYDDNIKITKLSEKSIKLLRETWNKQSKKNICKIH